MLTTPAVQATFDRTIPAETLDAVWDCILPDTHAEIDRLALTAVFFRFVAHGSIGDVAYLDEDGREQADVAADEIDADIERIASDTLAELAWSASKLDAA